jgi:hypothetical protein
MAHSLQNTEAKPVKRFHFNAADPAAFRLSRKVISQERSDHGF